MSLAPAALTMDVEALILAPLRAACAAAGFDLFAPVAVGAYNRAVDGVLRLEAFGSEGSLAVVVGNTRALWPKWLGAIARDPALALEADPLERYTERVIATALDAIPVAAEVRYAHERGARCVAIQRLAHVAGLAYASPTHQSVHPVYGPWIGLRAAVSFDAPAPPAAMAITPLEHPCGDCRARCQPAFERALAAMGRELSQARAREHWRLWLACRDACPVGQEHRYGEAQIRYHYLQDREQLRGAHVRQSTEEER